MVLEHKHGYESSWVFLSHRVPKANTKNYQSFYRPFQINYGVVYKIYLMHF